MRLLVTIFSATMALFLLISSTGCSTGPTTVERDYGNSVRNMIQAQTLDHLAAAAPDPNPIDYGDGERADHVLEAYRSDVATPEDVKQDIIINTSQ